MLFKTVHLPAAYSAIPVDEEGAQNYCSALLTILEDALANCVILADVSGGVEAALERSAERWPPKYAPRFRTLLKELRRSNRFVSLPLTDITDPSRPANVCQVALAIASQQNPDAVMIPNLCQCDGACDEMKRGIRVSEYKLSTFNDRCQHGQDLALGNGEYSRQDFERVVLKPVLRHAKHVALIDRQIGLATAKSGGSAPDVPENYRQTVRWVYELFRNVSDPSRPRTLDIYTAIDDRTEASIILDSVEALRAIGESVGSGGPPLTVHVKLDRGSPGFPHDRFLITDQTALQIGRGFDLLNRQGRIRSTIVQQVRGQPYLAAVRAMDDATPANLLAGSLGRISRAPARPK